MPDASCPLLRFFLQMNEQPRSKKKGWWGNFIVARCDSCTRGGPIKRPANCIFRGFLYTKDPGEKERGLLIYRLAGLVYRQPRYAVYGITDTTPR